MSEAKKVDTKKIVALLFSYGSDKVYDAARLSPEANAALGQLFDAVARGSSSMPLTSVTMAPDARPTKKSAKSAKESALWMEIIAELSRGIFFRKPVGPAPADDDGRIEFFARQLKNATLEAGRAWADLTEVVERVCLEYLKNRGCQLAVSTVMRATGSEAVNFEHKKWLITMWESYARIIGFTLKKIVDMFPVGKLLREYPRLQGYSCPERLSGHVEYIRDMLKFDDDISSEFMRPISIDDDLHVDPEKAKRAQQHADAEKSARKKRTREEAAAPVAQVAEPEDNDDEDYEEDAETVEEDVAEPEEDAEPAEEVGESTDEELSRKTRKLHIVRKTM